MTLLAMGLLMRIHRDTQMAALGLSAKPRTRKPVKATVRRSPLLGGNKRA